MQLVVNYCFLILKMWCYLGLNIKCQGHWRVSIRIGMGEKKSNFKMSKIV